MSRLTIILGQKQKCNTIPIGRVGENIVTEVAFDFSAWAEEYGTGDVALVAQRNGDAQPYPVTLTVSGTVAVWSITDADVAITGMGKAQVSYIVGEAVKKSDIYQTVCHNSLTGTGEAPDPYDDWMDALERLTAQNSAYAQQASESATNAFNSAKQAQEALEEFENVTVSATTLPEGSSATASYADGHIAFGIPRGNTGATGATGPQGATGPIGPTGEDGITPDFEIGTVETLDAGSDATATITGTTEAPILNLGIPRGADGATPTIYGNASGSIASFDDGADGRAVKSLTVDIEPVQSGSGTPSPDNVRPISGWTGAVVTRTGANLADTTTYPITFPSTVYGGLQVDAQGVCKIVVTHKEVNIPDINWLRQDDDFVYFIDNELKMPQTPIASAYQGIYFAAGSGLGVMGNGTIAVTNSVSLPIVRIRLTDIGNDASLRIGSAVFELAEPIEITLPDTMNITTLLGNNNIYADTGDVDVTYVRDWNIVINKLLS